MHSLPILAATRAETFFNAMPHLVGMLMVLITLSILWGICELSALLVQRFMPAAAPATAPPAPHPAAEARAIPPETVAVIAAAVTTVLGADHKVVSIKSQDSAWEKAGRQAVLTSHRIR